MNFGMTGTYHYRHDAAGLEVVSDRARRIPARVSRFPLHREGSGSRTTPRCALKTGAPHQRALTGNYPGLRVSGMWLENLPSPLGSRTHLTSWLYHRLSSSGGRMEGCVPC